MAKVWYSKTAASGGEALDLDSINGTELADNDLAFVMDPKHFAPYRVNASSSVTELDPFVIEPDLTPSTKRWYLKQSGQSGKAGSIYGLGISNAADTEHDLTIAAGRARDATDAHTLILTSAITKRGDAAWAVGTGNGAMSGNEGLDARLLTLDVAPGGAGWAAGDTITGVTSGTTCKIVEVLTATTYKVTDNYGVAFTLGEVLTNGTATADQGAARPLCQTQYCSIYVWLIKRTDTHIVDVMFSNSYFSGLSPTLPTNYTLKRRIGTMIVDASANISNGDWFGSGNERVFMLDTPLLLINNATPGTSPNYGTNLGIWPRHMPLRLITNMTSAATGIPNLTHYGSDLTAPSNTVAPLHVAGGSIGTPGAQAEVLSDGSDFVYQCGANVAVYGALLGWEDFL